MKRLALLLSLAVGAMDAVTGLLLIFTPSLVMKLLGIPALPPESQVPMEWIGVFVFSIGVSYSLTMRGRSAAETVWIFTTIVRSSVAVFLAVRIAGGALPVAWAVVAAADATVAVVQMIGLKAGWWKDPA
jgi:hypothetical protein